MVELSIIELLKQTSNVVSYGSRGLELSVVIFLTFQYFKSKSNYVSPYFVILNIGYITDLLLFFNGVFPWDSFFDGFSSFIQIIHTWHNTYFMTIWNAFLCLNRCTALAFPLKHDKIWTRFSMFFIIPFMLIFPFIIDGYQFLNFTCSPNNIGACSIFRHDYYIIGTIANVTINIVLIIIIGFCMYRSSKDKVQTHSLHAKIERRLIYQAIFSSVFQLIYFILKYISSIFPYGSLEIYIFVYLSNSIYNLQHFIVIVTHFIFSPLFKMAFLKFYHLQFLQRNSLKIISNNTQFIKISNPKN